LWVIKLVIATKKFGSKLEPKVDNNLGWNPNIFRYKDWSGYPEINKRDWLIINLLQVPIYELSKTLKRVTLLSTEAKYALISEISKEVIFCLLFIHE
jgi:hypothetical protein